MNRSDETVASSPGVPVAFDRSHRRTIFAASLGTAFEWYDFYLYASLSSVISRQFFSGVDETSSSIFTLLAFAVGFVVRPFGALVFGRLGDLVGRKKTFLITIVLMGIATALVGVLPTYASVGVAAPIALITLRMVQGLALGGEYGGAAIYVAEHAPPGKRGLYTSWIQTTAGIGLLMSLLLILACRTFLGAEAFDAWGWRIPFLVSLVLLGISVYIRLQLEESPVFQAMKGAGKLSTAPVAESLGRWDNLKVVLLALFGLMTGEAVVAYASQFYMMFFVEKILKVPPTSAHLIFAAMIVIVTPLFVFFGALSDRIGRKPIIMGGMLLAALLYFPLFKALTHYANPALDAAITQSPITVRADPAECSFQFDPVGRKAFTSSCDVAKSALAKAGVPYTNEPAPVGTIASVRVGESPAIAAFDGTRLESQAFKAASKEFSETVGAALRSAGYPATADPERIHFPAVIAICVLLTLFIAMAYGPIAAWLVELFPPHIRYTSLSLPYHIGNGWFGGFVPVVAFSIVVATGNLYAGLWYPIIVIAMTVVIGTLFLPDNARRRS